MMGTCPNCGGETDVIMGGNHRYCTCHTHESSLDVCPFCYEMVHGEEDMARHLDTCEMHAQCRADAGLPDHAARIAELEAQLLMVHEAFLKRWPNYASNDLSTAEDMINCLEYQVEQLQYQTRVNASLKEALDQALRV